MLQENVSLKKYNTFGIEAVARYFSTFTDVNGLQELLSFSDGSPLILGGGSNILFTKNIDGLVIKNDIKGIQKVREDEGHVFIKAGAGENWHQLVIYCIDNHLGGMENLSLIPGNAGASPMQNIGAYGVEIKDIFYELEAFDLEEKKMVVFSNSDCQFGYRESVFKGKYKGRFIITTVTYRLTKIPRFNISYGAIQQELETMGVKELSLKAISQAVINIRGSKLPNPAVTGNAGSFFKNPEVDNAVFEAMKISFPGIVGYMLEGGKTKLAAGWMIEQCGWKGYRKGDAGCHPKQALVLVNYGHATGSEILQLSDEIIGSVVQKFGVLLQREVNVF